MKHWLNKSDSLSGASRRQYWVVARLCVFTITCLISLRLWAWEAPDPAVRVVDQISILDVFGRQRLTESILQVESQSSVAILFLILPNPLSIKQDWARAWNPYPASSGSKLMLATNPDLSVLGLASTPPLSKSHVETIKTAFLSAIGEINQPFAKRAARGVTSLGPVLARVTPSWASESEAARKAPRLDDQGQEGQMRDSAVGMSNGESTIEKSFLPWIVLAGLIMAFLWILLDRLRASLDQTVSPFLSWWLVAMIKKTKNSRQSDKASKEIKADSNGEHHTH